MKAYGDKRLGQYLRFGFPLSITESKRDKLKCQQLVNHASARNFPIQVNQYIHKELTKGALYGPWDNVPHADIHCSPLLSRPKDNNIKRRIILDLSFPYGQSLNDMVDREHFDDSKFQLKFPTIDDIVKEVSHLEDPVISKIDIARAFRQMVVDPRDSLKLGIHWENKYYIDGSCAFGFAHGSTAHQLISDLLVHIMHSKRFRLFGYLDDYILVTEKHEADSAFKQLFALIQELGLEINFDKVVSPSKVVTCLGVTIDIANNRLSIAQEKIQRAISLISHATSRKVITKRELQSITGTLLYLHRCVHPARTFVNRTLALLRLNHTKKGIKLNKDFHADMAWFLAFLEKFNGVTIFDCAKSTAGDVYIDACLTGLGAIWGKEVYATPAFPGFENQLHITQLEMANITVALPVWPNKWALKTIQFHCDNHAVVQIVRSGRTHDKFLALCLRNIWLICAQHDIKILINHVSGKKNKEADLLSRVYSDSNIDQFLYNRLKTTCVWHHITIDHFVLDMSL